MPSQLLKAACGYIIANKVMFFVRLKRGVLETKTVEFLPLNTNAEELVTA